MPFVFLEEEPRLFSPPWALGLGLAFGFYFLRLTPGAVLVAAMAAAAAGSVLLGLRARAPRLRAILCLAAALGLALGAALRRDEAGAAVAPLLPASPLPPAAARPPAAPHPPLGAPIGAAAGLAVGGSAAGAASRPLSVVGVEGRLSADSTLSQSGFRSYPLSLTALLLEGPGLAGWVEASGPCRLLVRGGEVLEAGAKIAARGRPGGATAAAASGLSASRPAVAGGSAARPAERSDPAASPAPQGPPAFFADPGGLQTWTGGGPVAALRSSLRRRFRAALGLAGGEGAASGLLVALLMGDRGGLDLEEAVDWKRAGCAHVLALSGQHLAILAALATFLAKPLLGPRKARLAALLLALAFVFMAGASPSLLRSLLMYSLGALAFFADRPQPGQTILALAFAVALPLDPAAARSLSFELSYLALAGLVLLAPRFEFLLLPVFPPFLAKALAAGLAAQAATAPLLAFTFGTLYPAGLLASVLSALLVAAFMWWGLAAALLCGFCPALAPLAAPVSRLLHGLLSGTMARFAAWPELALPGRRGAALASALVVLGACFVYALPHVEHRIWLRRLAAGERPGAVPRGLRPGERRPDEAPRAQVRLPGLPARPPGRGGARDVEALRPELPRKSDLPRAHPRGASQGPFRQPEERRGRRRQGWRRRKSRRRRQGRRRGRGRRGYVRAH
ncbi:MAG TPA: ComEC/Rec2 family competence protein [Spirochaetales bacterium]|nr:ComEC/Rec2 family competence protein [Spirochaetales bacterium]